MLDEYEEEVRYMGVNRDVEESLYDKHGSGAFDRLNDLSFLRSLPDEAFGDREKLAEVTSNVKAATAALAVVQDNEKPAQMKHEEITSLLAELSGDSLIRFADHFCFHYGDAFNDYDGLSRSEVRASFNVQASLMKNWDENIKTPGGKPFDGFATGKNGRRQAFLRAEYVSKIVAPKNGL